MIAADVVCYPASAREDCASTGLSGWGDEGQRESFRGLFGEVTAESAQGGTEDGSGGAAGEPAIGTVAGGGHAVLAADPRRAGPVHIYDPSDPALARPADDPDLIGAMAAGILAGRDPKTLKGWEGRRLNCYRVVVKDREVRRYSRTEVLMVAATLPGWSPPDPGEPAHPATPPAGDGAPEPADAGCGVQRDPVRVMQQVALLLDPALRAQILASARQYTEMRHQLRRLTEQVDQHGEQLAGMVGALGIGTLDRAGVRARLVEILALLDGEA